MNILDIGKTHYTKAIAIMNRIREDILLGKSNGTLICTHHYDCFTEPRYDIEPGKICRYIESHGKILPVFSTDRGGGITYHGKGQLVFYFVIPMIIQKNSYINSLDKKIDKLDIISFIKDIENTVVLTLGSIGIPCERLDNMHGVWVKHKNFDSKNNDNKFNNKDNETNHKPNHNILSMYQKISFIGLRVKRNIIYHGISININPDLRMFKAISPCGIEGISVTSIKNFSKKIGITWEVDYIKNLLISKFLQILH